MSFVADFMVRVQTVFKTGQATEHSYRAALEGLFDSIAEGITALNEPKRVACGAPDFIIQRGDIVIGHVEAKDLHIGLRHMKDANKSQFDRYIKALPNLIYTNCLDFDFYREGKLLASVSIADLVMGIQPKPENYAPLENLLKDFIAQRPQTIKSPKTLAEMLAGKAVLIKDVMAQALKADKDVRSELTSQFQAFREHLIHDITPDDFADLYAETIAYGMFAARLHDETPKTFTRVEALELLPKSNPFLRSLFGYIAGPDLDDRIRWIIDDLADVFQATDMHAILEGFGKLTGRNDPFLHFYETFLAAYNPAKRKARGVWYTPEAVVNFIVRAVDEVLIAEFGLADGLADTSKVTVDWDTGQLDMKGKPITIRKDVHRVQILDPATGTGTFLAEVIKQIAPRVKGVAEGMWSQYIERDLIPRLHGFELLMASYAMCHMKLDMVLTELGYRPTGTPPRLSVYLTNSLEEGGAANYTLPFAQWLSNEVQAANTIKRDMPIMCVIGNPPYSGESANKGDWIMGLMDAYKKEPGGKEKLKERNPKWINDDYVKFIRMSEHLIARNGEGVLGFITNHGYLDNPTFRGMRWHLLKTFDRIYVLDLHGNSKKKEVSPDGEADKNVFDIQQGVAVIVAVKRAGATKDKPLAEVRHGELWGDRKGKYSALWSNSLTGAVWKKLENRAPAFPMVRRNYDVEVVYLKGFGVQELMPVNSVGIVTARDDLTIDMDRQALWERVQAFATMDPEAARARYRLGKDVRDWQVAWAQRDVGAVPDAAKLQQIAYRPFDARWTYYTGNSRGFICYPREEVMGNYSSKPNLGLLVSKAHRDRDFGHAIATTLFNEAIYLSGTTASNAMNFPLYLYPSPSDHDQTRRVNFDPVIYAAICKAAGLSPSPASGRGWPEGPGEGSGIPLPHPPAGTFSREREKDDSPPEVQVFDYIYGVLHCPAYRQTYAEFLKIDFPRIPYPASPESFADISAKGAALRRLHLMEPAAIGETPYPFRGEGDTVVDKLEFTAGRVHINKTQYFDAVPELAWTFFIGGYQPAQKWLKDRKGRALTFEDVKHYQRIIKILSETDRIMKTITMPGLNT
jgi:predicted helicase